MHLLIRKSQRDDGWFASAITFILDARLDLDDEEQELFERYRLYEMIVYSSNAKIQHLHSAIEDYEAAQKTMTPLPWEPSVLELSRAFLEIGVMTWHLGAGAAHEVASALSLQITLGTLTNGQHLETESLEEILAVANSITASVEYLSTYLGVALTFDGREELYD